MVETYWREILSFSQRELMQADKDKLCESLSWMEADDIELNFTDLKTIFRLAQDILKYKSEQVNNLMGEIEKGSRRNKSKHKKLPTESTSKNSDTALDTIATQEDVIKSNKEIIQQLNLEIAKLEERKKKFETDVYVDSESSRDPLSEMNATVQLENEIFKKNRHIRKLLVDVKLLEEENVKQKEKLSQLKDKLNEATQLIENLTEQLFSVNSECNKLKEALGKYEETKTRLLAKIDSLKKEISTKDVPKENTHEDVTSKLQYLKNSLKSHKNEIERLSAENTQLKESLIFASKSPTSPNETKEYTEETKNKIIELQDKLMEASIKIEQSAKLIQLLKAENKRVKSIIEDGTDLSIPENRNESDDGKEKNMITKLRCKLRNITVTLRATEEMVANREKELANVASQLQLVQSEDGVKTLLKGLQSKTRQLKLKDEGIKSLVIEINNLHQHIDELQLENESLRQKFNIPSENKIPSRGILKKYQDLQERILHITNELHKNENKLVSLEIENRIKDKKIKKYMKVLYKLGLDHKKLTEALKELSDNSDSEDEIKTQRANIKKGNNAENMENTSKDLEIQEIIKENEGLRVGLHEILDFLKDNSTTSSGILSLNCPTLESICHSMDARHAAGWFAPHMAAVMELKAALGGKDALLTALHESRKETFEVMKQLSKETEKSSRLEKQLHEVESHKNKENSAQDAHETIHSNQTIFDPAHWNSDTELNLDYFDKDQVQGMLTRRNIQYENQLKNCLNYFQGKFTLLYDKINSLAINAADNENKWLIQEEKLKAEIENLKGKLLHNVDDDISIQSPGLVTNTDVLELQRKISYLEESYKHIRTQNENLKNEYSECNREMMLMAADYESNIQSLIACNINMCDKLRRCIPADLFWQQNDVLNELNIKYRNFSETFIYKHLGNSDLLNQLKEDKLYILNYFKNDAYTNELILEKKKEENLEKLIYEKQLEQLTSELSKKDTQIDILIKRNEEVQILSTKFADRLIDSKDNKGENNLEEQIYHLREENKSIKQERQRLQTQLDLTLLKLQENQQQKFNTDIEINSLRHQILDLQSTGESKAIIARLSGEILTAHMQSSEINKKIERLTVALNKEKHKRFEIEEMLKTRQKLLDNYIFSTEQKLRNIFEVLQIFKQEYLGSIPLCTIDTFLTKLEDLNRKTFAADEKLEEIEDLQAKLMMKNSVYNQILETTKTQCHDENICEHILKYTLTNSTQIHELDLCSKKIQTLELSRKIILDRCNYLERTLLLISQGFNISLESKQMEINKSNHFISEMPTEIEDIASDDESKSSRNITFTVPKTELVKLPEQSEKNGTSESCKSDTHLNNTHINDSQQHKPELVNVHTQTAFLDKNLRSTKVIQTDEDHRIREMQCEIKNLNADYKNQQKKVSKMTIEIQSLSQNLCSANEQKHLLEYTVQNLTDSHNQKDILIKSLQSNIDSFKNQIDNFKSNQYAQILQENTKSKEENRTLLQTLKDLQNEKKSIITEYQEILKKEREDYANTIKQSQTKLLEIQSQLDGRGTNADTSRETTTEIVGKYVLKITELEDRCFKLQNNLDGSKSEIIACQRELERWKDLANERLSKMEQLGAQLKERHNDEVETYKAENQHWLSQLNETQREHMDLRSRLTEQKALYLKQLADKDGHIEQLRTVVQNLKTQILNMQTMLSINDPSFDLSAIVEVEEASDAVSPHGSERLELKYESVVDLQNFQDDLMKVSSTSTAIWQEPLIERLRREKQLISKQNAILRRQIKAVAARERRARLDAQNLKNQVFRITTSGNKVTSVESAALQNKIASLQAQLASARRDAHSSVALWDKWKRAQQAAEKWQARYEEKCREEKNLEASLTLSKSALSRLEKEKRVLLSRLSELKSDRSSLAEKQDEERSEKGTRSQSDYAGSPPPPVSTRALLDRIQAQQRRIAALEVAEKGNEPLVSEYEKSLAEITSLKGQVLKLESTLLEAQIRTPVNPSSDPRPELEYWKSYCDMLKEENMQLTLRVNSLETTPASAHQHRINDLEQTVLTLRSLVSKLQADQKSGVVKRVDSRPGSGRSTGEKVRNQIDTYRTEISNLKRTIQEKDLLLERSKEMLKIAAEREDELLKENDYLRRQLDEILEHKGEFLST